MPETVTKEAAETKLAELMEREFLDRQGALERFATWARDLSRPIAKRLEVLDLLAVLEPDIYGEELRQRTAGHAEAKAHKAAMASGPEAQLREFMQREGVDRGEAFVRLQAQAEDPTNPIEHRLHVYDILAWDRPFRFNDELRSLKSHLDEFTAYMAKTGLDGTAALDKLKARVDDDGTNPAERARVCAIMAAIEPGLYLKRSQALTLNQRNIRAGFENANAEFGHTAWSSGNASVKK